MKALRRYNCLHLPRPYNAHPLRYLFDNRKSSKVQFYENARQGVKGAKLELKLKRTAYYESTIRRPANRNAQDIHANGYAYY